MADNQILVGANTEGKQVFILGSMANRHGLIAGATGTGKTVSLQVLAEGFSKMGVPVFAADVKGDLSGLAAEGKPHKKIDERIKKIDMPNYRTRKYPVLCWDLFGSKGHHVRTTISEVGPLLLGRVIDLNENQQGLLEMAFSIADDEGLLLLDVKDLQSMLSWMGENASDLQLKYGNISKSSLGAILRRLLVLNDAGGEIFFGEPALKLEHLMQTDFSGNGVISILDAVQLQSDPRLYSSFLLWLLSELFEQLEEVGDQDKPRLIFFFDEAHLLFADAPKALCEKIERVVRLIRSKGVGIYFVTQHPLDLPEEVLGQLGNRIQHALRAFTPKDEKALRTAADTFRANSDFDAAEIIRELKEGEALVSVLDEDGSPTVVERVLICPPESRIGPIDETERKEVLGRSPLKGIYEEALDRESAYEILKKKAEEKKEAESKEEEVEKKKGHSRQGVGEAFIKSVVRTIGTNLGRQIVRGILGSLLPSKKK